jgi:hypothetical protein
MYELMNQLAFSLFKKNNLQDSSPDELRIFANQFPYYPVAQLLYTARLKEINSSNYTKELQKTSLYFTNPLWLNFLLANPDLEDIPTSKENKPAEIPYEDFNNDELVVENPVHEFLTGKTFLNENKSNTDREETAEKNEPAFVFEPYYTVDYFASQGIKPVPEEKPKDRFEQQLKSFTEWLKTLKNKPPQEIASQMDNAAEEKVIHLADHSIEDRNVITEAMAEVWIKQGQPEKATAIYDKLSLLNPSKSSYFAGLKENLKKN